MAARTVTLKGLAERLGLHVSTVSRVLNGDPQRAREAASPEVGERIRQLARELDYMPHVQAVNLRTQRSREIAVLVPRVSDLVVATAYEGIVSAALEAGYSPFVSTTADDPERQLALVRQALRLRVAGVLLSDVHLRTRQPGIDLLVDSGMPFVLVYRRRGRHVSAGGDDLLGGRLVAEHLHAMGHRRVGVLAGPRHASTGVDRTRGFIGRCTELGLQVAASAVVHGDFDAAAGHACGLQLLREHPRLTAVFAVNDFLAIGLMGASRELGRRVGDDLAIVGYNDTPIAAELPVPLSSVQVPMHEVGRTALQLLLDRIAGRVVRSVQMTPRLCVRESSAGKTRPRPGPRSQAL